MRDRGFVDRQLSNLGAWRIILPRILILSGDQDFFVGNVRMISAVELKKCMINVGVFFIIVGKFRHTMKSCPIILLEIKKDLKISFYHTILSLSLTTYLKIKGG